MTHVYNTAQKQRLRAMADAFHASRRHVQAEFGLCKAIWDSGATLDARHDCCALIRRALRGATWLEGWQHARGIRRTNEQLLTDRLAWLDQLIADIEAAVQS